MTCSRFLLNVCFVIGNLSRWFVMTCWSAASLHLHLLNVSNWVYNLMQTHATPYPFVGFVTCISRSRERNCPSYVPVSFTCFGSFTILLPQQYIISWAMLITSRSSFEFLHSALLAITSVTLVISEVIIRRRSKYRESGIRRRAHSRLTSLTLSGAVQIPPISDISCLMCFTTRKISFSILSSHFLLCNSAQAFSMSWTIIVLP